jgi:hypothetical protein
MFIQRQRQRLISTAGIMLLQTARNLATVSFSEPLPDSEKQRKARAHLHDNHLVGGEVVLDVRSSGAVREQEALVPAGKEEPAEGFRFFQNLLLVIVNHARASALRYVLRQIVSPKMSFGLFISQQDLCRRLLLRSAE